MSLHQVEIAGKCESILDEVYREYRLETIPDGSGSSHYGGPEGWIFGLDMVRVDPVRCPLLNRAIRELRLNVQVGPLMQTMVNRLRPNGELKAHRDGPPDRLRFHLPVQTNDAAHWWDEIHGYEQMKRGHWYGPVPYCGVLHSVANYGESDRIHVVCDFERR